MVRTAELHLLLRGRLRFSTTSHPEALGARYSALWRLPRPDLHRLVDGDLQGTPSAAVKCCAGASAFARDCKRTFLYGCDHATLWLLELPRRRLLIRCNWMR